MEELDLVNATSAPLAELLRPQSLEDVVGQDSLLGENGHLRLLLDECTLGSIILSGPPGTGKTAIASLLAAAVDMVFQPVPAVFDGVVELRRKLCQKNISELVNDWANK